MIEPTDEMRKAVADRIEDVFAYRRTLHVCEHLEEIAELAVAAVLPLVERDYDVRERVVVHLATKGDVNMHCCGRTPFELPRGDRMTLDPHGWNCQGPYT